MAPSTGSAYAVLTDSPSVFARNSHDVEQEGGRFRIAPAWEQLRLQPFYWPDTAVLVTRFLHNDGVGEIEDYMPVGGAYACADELIRRVRVVRGKMSFQQLECRPAFDYARASHKLHLGPHGARFDGPEMSLSLASAVPLAKDGDGVIAGIHTRRRGESDRSFCACGPGRRTPPRTLPRRRRSRRTVP